MKNITIYSTPSCVYCNMAKNFFHNNNVDFTDYNVSTDLDKRKEMIELTGQMGVPVIKLDQEVVVGFDEPKIKTVLGIK